MQVEMPTGIKARLGLSVVLSLLVVTAAYSQTPDARGKRYGMGLKFASPNQFSRFSRVQVKHDAPPPPPRADLSPLMPPVGDQGQQGSCVAWSVGYTLRSYYVGAADKVSLAQPQNIPSPAYIYNYNSAGLEDKACLEAGMELWQALNILKAGVVSMAEMPYNEKHCSPAPSVAMQAAAKKFRIDSWDFIAPSEITTIKSELAAGNPVAFGMDMGESLWMYDSDRVYRRPPFEGKIGGHAMVLIGYDDDKQAFRVQNSWGTSWGDKGRFWLAYDTFKEDAEGGYVIRLWQGRQPQQPQQQ